MYLPISYMNSLAVKGLLSFSSILSTLSKKGIMYFSNSIYLSFGTKMFPILFTPFFLSSASSTSQSPRMKGFNDFMKSSSTPPAVVTITSTFFSLTSQAMISLRPEDIMFDV
ncbi:111aa long hypothetical protein [Pyrococcus horikoshii OT3]|uniref:Uncharacterized protein n=1 Tax=Pyrococcus horikoshii (strain ATCC 700860 / DSM 12428 / JCM 9974 / NBRC 100139 / OT-3) TaxID=70601 RepID=O50106_PYRHO|nr:111aa long hypothetical protein [Pyrococcus horikoshii OT3]